MRIGRLVAIVVITIVLFILALIFFYIGEAYVREFLLQRTYNSFVAETQKTQDEITQNVSCGSVTFNVIHTDEAIEGAINTIDRVGSAPKIVQKYYLQAFIGSRKIFSVNGLLEYLDTFSTGQLPNIDSIDTALIVDKSAFSKIESTQGGGENTRIIVFPGAYISDSELSALAGCFAKYAKDLNEASRFTVAAFIIMKENPRAHYSTIYDEFRCSNGHKVTLSNNLARLDEDTYSIIGTLNLQGYLRSFITRDRAFSSYADMGMAQPVGDRADISPWENCRNVRGQTFGQYISELSLKVKHIDD